VWVGVDNAWEQDKLEARKMLENSYSTHTSGARFVGRACYRDYVVNYSPKSTDEHLLLPRTAYLSKNHPPHKAEKQGKKWAKMASRHSPPTPQGGLYKKKQLAKSKFP